MANVQVNLRVPADQKDLIHETARRLREDDGFAERLRALVESDQAAPGVQDQLNELFERVAALETAGGQATPWLDARGRLTSEGEAELERRLQAGDRVNDVADALGVTASAVSRRKAKLGL